MWFWILRLAVKTKIFCKGMDESSLMSLHRLESKSFLFLVGSEYSEFTLVLLSKLGTFGEKCQSSGGIRNMIVLMSRRIDIESSCKLSISLKLETLIITLQNLIRVSF